jgi:hypothetical protein
MTEQTKRASARRHSRARRDAALLDALENHVASTATTSLVDHLRAYGFSDPYIAAALLAGATSLIRGLPDTKPWAVFLEQLATNVRAENGRI